MQAPSAQTDSSKYPPGSIMAEMLIDIYASNWSGAVLVLHDRPFPRPPEALELDVARRELWFATDHARIPFGAPLQPGLVGPMKRARSITFLQMSRDPAEPPRAELAAALERFFGSSHGEWQPVAALEVPLRLHGPGPGLLEPLRRTLGRVAGLVREGTYALWIQVFPEL